VCDRLFELRVLRQIELAAHHVHRQARDAQLLVTARIDVTDFGDRGRLPQQSQRIQPTLIDRDRARAPRSLRHPGELMLELAHELVDADRGSERLFVLNARQGGLVFLVRKVDPDQTAYDERSAHQDHERYRVLEEQTSTHQAISLRDADHCRHRSGGSYRSSERQPAGEASS
jgi:hypothetical protein